jgi:hypothetical protein
MQITSSSVSMGERVLKEMPTGMVPFLAHVTKFNGQVLSANFLRMTKWHFEIAQLFV